MSDVQEKVIKAKEISRFLNSVTTAKKNEALQLMANALRAQSKFLLDENKKDLKRGEENGMSQSLLDRLSLNSDRINGMAEGLEIVISLPDPIGEVMEGWTRPNGLSMIKKRVPIGVIGIIYEARPNVTVDAVGLTLKSSNAVVLRGSSSAHMSNKAIVSVLNEAAKHADFPDNFVQLIEDTSRETVKELVSSNGYVDLVIPRGGVGLIQTVVKSATVPCIETGVGNCHVYIDEDAIKENAIKIAVNAKVQRPSVCNSAETLLIHKNVAREYLPSIIKELKESDVEIFGCKETQAIDPTINDVTDEHYATEFLDYKIAIKVVETVDVAIDHIYKYGTMHTEAIVSENVTTINKFKQEVDASAIMVNVSTRFTDGFEFGFGAEIGISTQKMHARGPMGLKELTTYKYVVEGSGQIRT